MLQCCSTAGISIPLLSICGLRSIKCMSCGQEHTCLTKLCTMCGQEHTCLNEPVLTGSGEGPHAPEDTFDLGGVHRRIAATGAVMGGYRVCLCPGCCHRRGWDCLSSVTGNHLAFSACRCIDMGECQDFCCSPTSSCNSPLLLARHSRPLCGFWCGVCGTTQTGCPPRLCKALKWGHAMLYPAASAGLTLLALLAVQGCCSWCGVCGTMWTGCPLACSSQCGASWALMGPTCLRCPSARCAPKGYFCLDWCCLSDTQPSIV